MYMFTRSIQNILNFFHIGQVLICSIDDFSISLDFMLYVTINVTKKPTTHGGCISTLVLYMQKNK